jgi:hypothetical protein
LKTAESKLLSKIGDYDFFLDGSPIALTSDGTSLYEFQPNGMFVRIDRFEVSKKQLTAYIGEEVLTLAMERK